MQKPVLSLKNRFPADSVPLCSNPSFQCPMLGLKHLIDTLTWVFLVIFAGYFSVYFKLITPDAVSGVGQLCGRVALPLLVFQGVTNVDLGSLNFKVILVALISKLCCLVLAMLLGCDFINVSFTRL